MRMYRPLSKLRASNSSRYSSNATAHSTAHANMAMSTFTRQGVDLRHRDNTSPTAAMTDRAPNAR